MLQKSNLRPYSSTQSWIWIYIREVKPMNHFYQYPKIPKRIWIRQILLFLKQHWAFSSVLSWGLSGGVCENSVHLCFLLKAVQGLGLVKFMKIVRFWYKWQFPFWLFVSHPVTQMLLKLELFFSRPCMGVLWVSTCGQLFNAHYTLLILHSFLVFMEENVRKPLKDTIFDVYFAKPLKVMYKRLRRLE